MLIANRCIHGPEVNYSDEVEDVLVVPSHTNTEVSTAPTYASIGNISVFSFGYPSFAPSLLLSYTFLPGSYEAKAPNAPDLVLICDITIFYSLTRWPNAVRWALASIAILAHQQRHTGDREVIEQGGSLKPILNYSYHLRSTLNLPSDSRVHLRGVTGYWLVFNVRLDLIAHNNSITGAKVAS